MGNRGKGPKGKSNKKGKGGKGKPRAGGASKWGDENAARADEDQPRRKKPRLTQETQDRRRRVKILELNRAKDRDQRHRLSQPNEEPAKTLTATPRAQRRKRSRSKRPAQSDGGRDALYYSSDEGGRARGGGGEEEDEARAKAEEASGGFDAGLLSYKKLLSALEVGSSRLSAAGGGDKDLAAAVEARRLQREGRDEGDSDSSGSNSNSSGDDEDEDEDGGDAEDDEDDEEEEGDVSQQNGHQGGKNTLKNKEELQAMDEESDGLDSTPSETQGSSDQEDGFDDAEVDPAVEDFGTDKDDDLLLLSRAGKTADGRGRDDFCRHFVSTPVFSSDQAAGLLSPSGRPSFKPLSGAARGKWEAMGLSASASRGADVPPPLTAGASLSQELGVLPSLADGWDACNDGSASKLQSLILPPLTGYRDMLYCGWRDEDADAIRRSYALHALNHALTSQRRVVRHTARLRKAAEETRVAEALARAAAGGATADLKKGTGKANGGQGSQRKPSLAKGGGGGGGAGAGAGLADKKSLSGDASLAGKTTVQSESDDWQRDQGFTRPKVLILLPFRGLAHELVEIMIGLLGPKTVVINKDRFNEEYGPDDEDESAEASGENGDGEGGGGDARAERAKAVLERKPGDWKALFGGGRNVDDMFTLGLSLSPGGGKGKPGEGKGVGVRLYCDFYNSDIVIASPVALHRASVPGGDGGGEGSGVDSDFLSSVEVCIMDRADVFLMQNWAYVPDLAAVLNTRPSGERAARADFSRVRPLFLHEQGRLFRQTLVFSAYQDPNLNALVSKQLRNHDGIVKVSRPTGDGHICKVALQAKQVFQRVPCDSPATQDDARFEYFVGTVLPQLLRAKQAHTAVFIPSYFDYVRARNHLMKNKASIVNVHEYSRGSEVARSRARFFRGDRELLLYTGRAHFFNRYCIRGIHHLIFYSLPECPQFYPEMVNLLEEAESVAAVTCLSLFTRFERLSLERIVGEDRAGHMLGSAKNTFLFC